MCFNFRLIFILVTVLLAVSDFHKNQWTLSPDLHY